MIASVASPDLPAALLPLVISRADEVRALRQLPALLRRRAVVIDVPGIDADVARAAADRVSSFANECGCSLGAQCMTAAFVVALTWLVRMHGLLTTAFLWHLPWALLCAFAGAAAGKTAGLLRARIGLRATLDQLLDTIPDRRD
jgi:hypothetical protein